MAGILLTHGSEEQKLSFARTLAEETAAVISLQAAVPDDPFARTLALQMVVQRKGRALDEAASTIALARGRADSVGRALLDDWRAARGRLAALFLKEARPEDAADSASETK